ncbi:hypothetical protein K788_0007798 [Paraburkholderia caribensis MBA4]|uniref:Uncharacterized protein n=1 Tax=Paraburkholderia caribensis MBA4 TaxID=1323664 RepID=A0A0P0R7W9_9BURK|nr:hypothetical protein K788_0007798 [Paraburkholderia caribensis MBA4]
MRAFRLRKKKRPEAHARRPIEWIERSSHVAFRDAVAPSVRSRCERP